MIALLSNVNVNGHALKTQIIRNSEHDVITPEGYNTWMQNLITSDFLCDGLKAAYVILDGNDLCASFIGSREKIRQHFVFYVDIIENFIKQHSEITVFVSSLDIPKVTPQAITTPRNEPFAEALWRQLLEERNIPILDMSDIVSKMGRDTFYSTKLRFLGGIPFTLKAEKALGEEIARLFNAVYGKRKKCLVLDMDNTLWGGVIGEEGLGIKLGGSYEGAAYKEFQRYIKLLKEQGILLAIASKNNMEDALLPLEQHPEMLLHKNDFVSIMADWNPKASNISSLAHELNLGLDSFVFIDDNPLEREAIKVALPSVTVPDFPETAWELPSYIVDISKKYFSVFTLTSEDLEKTKQYHAEAVRKAEKSNFVNIDDYLESLKMNLTIEKIGDATLSRAAQMTQKTNQFNLTTKRYSEADLKELMEHEKQWLMSIGKLDDRFGEYGYSILALVKLCEGNTASIDTFLMSCRIMGRQVEYAFLSALENKLRELGVSRIFASYIQTSKNSVVKTFWTENGYVSIDEHSFSKHLDDGKSITSPFLNLTMKNL